MTEDQVIPEERRREIFLALVEAQDQDMSVPESRETVARRFGIDARQLRAIEQEGLNNTWPPL
jgi:2-hydroxychromene-2-carboxylate isomerase